MKAGYFKQKRRLLEGCGVTPRIYNRAEEPSLWMGEVQSSFRDPGSSPSGLSPPGAGLTTLSN